MKLNAYFANLHAMDLLNLVRQWRMTARRTRLACLAGWLSSIASVLFASDVPVIERAMQVELPNQEENAVKTSWPAIGCWFWQKDEFQPDGYKHFIDLYARHSPFKLFTTSFRWQGELTDPKVHDHVKAAAEYARQKGMALVLDLDVRMARKPFLDKYPDEMQEIVRLRELALSDAGESSITIEPFQAGDHYCYGRYNYKCIAGRLLRVYSYVTGADGIEPDSVRDITAQATVVCADNQKGVMLSIPGTNESKGRTACVMAAFTLLTPDVFSPHLAEFQRDILKQYADVPLAGACKDEWGFPGRAHYKNFYDDIYFSKSMAGAYAKRRAGHDLIRDLLLMVKGEKGRGGERAAAINHWMEMIWQQNAQVELEYYHAIKEVFGPQAMSATHPTWVSMPSMAEVFKNGLDWWAVTRDLAQTDEQAPYCVRTALAKKWHSPLWYNMYYGKSLKPYEEELWRNALSGGRINYHPPYPATKEMPLPLQKMPLSLRLLSIGDKLLRADCRVRLLNFISTRPVDCPVAVVFSHPRVCNWADEGRGDAGVRLCDALWKQGYYTDLIPSSEIVSGALKLSQDGYVQYGPQKYAAVVFYQPQYERPLAGQFFRQAAAAGKTTLYRVGDWTLDFDGNAIDGKTALPAAMKPVKADACARDVIAQLKEMGVESYQFGLSGWCRLLDGTVILASGEKDALGDPIRKTVKVGGQEVSFDAVGVAAARLDKDGRLESLAGGALKSFRGGGVTIKLPERIDLALWRDAKGRWHGVLQDYAGPVPKDLAALTDDWKRLTVPIPYP